MKEKLRLLGPVVLLLALLAIAYSLLTYESDVLWKAQELNMFLDTPLFFKQQMVTSGWLLTWLGTYFTEFFYHPWIGVTMLMLWWALLMFVTARAFRVPAKWAVLLLIPVAALLVSDVSLGYWLYYNKLRGIYFVGTIGTTIAVSAVWLYRLVPAKFFLRTVYIAVSTALLYPLIGCYALLAALLMAVLSWRLEDYKLTDRIVATIVAAAAIGIVPLAYYNYVFDQTIIDDIYRTGLPAFTIDKEYPVYYLPYLALALALVALAATSRLLKDTIRRPVIWICCQVVVLAVLIAGVRYFWYDDYNYHKELAMQHYMEDLDWEGVRQEAANLEDEPTRAIVMMKNLALFRLGRQGDTMYQYRTGSKASDAPFPIAMVDIVGVPLYFHYGQYNFCYRWCMEAGVERGWRVFNLKNFIRCAMVSGEQQLAKKYLNQLKHTRYHREWAEQHLALLEKGTIGSSQEFEPVMHLTKVPDVLNSDNTLVEKFIMTQFANNPSNDTLYIEQAVYASLWTKDIPTFWRNFFPYAQTHVGQHMPTHLQEAAYLYGELEKNIDTSNMPFDKSVPQTYKELMQAAQGYANLDEDGMARALFPRFGQTYFYEYYFVRNQKLY